MIQKFDIKKKVLEYSSFLEHVQYIFITRTGSISDNDDVNR